MVGLRTARPRVQHIKMRRRPSNLRADPGVCEEVHLSHVEDAFQTESELADRAGIATLGTQPQVLESPCVVGLQFSVVHCIQRRPREQRMNCVFQPRTASQGDDGGSAVVRVLDQLFQNQELGGFRVEQAA